MDTATKKRRRLYTWCGPSLEDKSDGGATVPTDKECPKRHIQPGWTYQQRIGVKLIDLLLEAEENTRDPAHPKSRKHIRDANSDSLQPKKAQRASSSASASTSTGKK